MLCTREGVWRFCCNRTCITLYVPSIETLSAHASCEGEWSRPASGTLLLAHDFISGETIRSLICRLECKWVILCGRRPLLTARALDPDHPFPAAPRHARLIDPIIYVENLSKRYIIGHQRDRRDALRHRLEAAMRAPLKWLRSCTTSKRNAKEEFWALKDVSFEVKEGEAMGIIGRNGAGKSTLLKILSRITEPTKGRVTLRGRVASLLEVGTGFHQELTGRENVFLNGAILGMSRAEIKRKFDEIVAFSEVEQFLDTPVKRYSSGMYVRLAFAVAAHLEPDILIVDEVLAVGDAEFQKKCLGKMGEVGHQGRTVLFVSHNLMAIKALCPKCIYLKNGSLVALSDTNQIIDTYLSDTHRLQTDTLLKERRDRGGNGTARIVGFYVFDNNRQKQPVLQSGSDYTFVMQYETPASNHAIRDVVASIGINDGNGHTILLYRSSFSNQNFVLFPDRSLIECRVTDLNLAAGTYHINLFLSQGDHDILDHVVDAAKVTVEGGDYFGSRSSGLPGICKVLSRSDWTVS
jgi:lipopolysaccharide transport system ATP-binding protein